MPPKILLFFFSLFSLACSNALAPPGDVQGTWAANFNLPGPSLVLEITQGGRTIAGGGTYAMEAGRAGTLQISGSYTRPRLGVIVQRDFGLSQPFVSMVHDYH